MRALVGGCVLLAVRLAVADEVVVARDSRGGRVDAALDAYGWTVEATVSIGDASAHGVVDITDDRRTTRLELTPYAVALDTQNAGIEKELRGTHALRIEQAGGRTLLFVDGELLLDRDQTLPELVVDKPRGVSFEARGAAPLHWDAIAVDVAPAHLARSSQPYRPATHFTGPFAPWLVGWAGRGPAHRAELAAIALPETARACVAFAMVAAISRTRPKHLRYGELTSEPKDESIRMQRQQMDVFDGPRGARITNSDRRAQAALRRSFGMKTPRDAYDQAVYIVTNMATMPEDATEYLLAQLAPLARSPNACR